MSEDEKRPVGNQPNSVRKWPDKLERQAACAALCDHLRKGYSMKAWPEASVETINRYVKDFPEDFCPDKINRAKREGEHFWESVGLEGTVGKIKGFNPKSWEFNMQNRYGWRIGFSQDMDMRSKSEVSFNFDGVTTDELFAVQNIFDKLVIHDNEGN